MTLFHTSSYYISYIFTQVEKWHLFCIISDYDCMESCFIFSISYIFLTNFYDLNIVFVAFYLDNASRPYSLIHEYSLTMWNLERYLVGMYRAAILY